MAVHLFPAAGLRRLPELGWTTPWVEPAVPATSVVFSWCQTLAPGAALRARAQLRSREGETAWLPVGVRGAARVDPAPPSPGSGIRLDADELVVEGGIRAVRLAIASEPGTLRPRLVGLTFWPAPDGPGSKAALDSLGPEVEPWLRLGRIAQHAVDPELGRHICGPCSLAMALLHRGVRVEPLEVEARVRDPWSGLRGNWTQLAAEAGERGLEAFVERGGGPPRLMEHLRAGRLAIVSLCWEEGELSGAPVARSGGHLVLAVGGDAKGLWVMDPAFPAEAGELHRYPWEGLTRCWRSGAMVVLGEKSPPGA